MILWSVTLKIGALTKLGLFFPVVCFIRVFDQTLAEQLYRDKGLLSFALTQRLIARIFYLFMTVFSRLSYIVALKHVGH